MEFLLNNTWFMFIALIWILPWKVAAMWTAAKKSDEKWFVFLLLAFIFPFGLLAIPDIFYFFFVAKRNWNGLKNIFEKKVD